MSTRLGFVLTLLLPLLVQNQWAYSVDFNLDIQGPYQIFLAVINPSADQSALHRSSTLYQTNQALL